MNRHDCFVSDRSAARETWDAKTLDRREFVKGVAALAGSAGLLGYDPCNCIRMKSFWIYFYNA